MDYLSGERVDCYLPFPFRTFRIMITSILYLQRERSLVVSGILIAQPTVHI